MSFAKFVLVVEYDGTRYHGFQWQAAVPTVQAEMERAINKLCGPSSRGMAASRTDAGVHARAQVLSFWAKSEMDTGVLIKGLNYYLPRDVAVKAAYKVDSSFNVSRDALSREYCYYLLNSGTRSPFSEVFALFVPQALDIEAMSQACQMMCGEHDFISFATALDDGQSTVRHVYDAEIDRKGEFIIFHVEANSFLRHQIRNTMGLLLRLGLGKIGIMDFRGIMEAKQQGLAGPTAPARGLCLTRVNYAGPIGG